MTVLDMLKRLENAFPGVYTKKIVEIERVGHWKELQEKAQKRGALMRQPEFRSMFAVLKPGKWKITDYSDWKDNSFGNCPACGAWGYETFPSMDSIDAWFGCTDGVCYTNFMLKVPTWLLDAGERARWDQLNNGIRPTVWTERKPAWWMEQQEQGGGYSWNWRMFSEDYCIENDLI